MIPVAPARLRPVVGLTACCVLAYEISLTRIFSVLFRSPFVFLILSIAVCGLGVGACLAPWWRRRAPAAWRLAGPALALAALLPLPLALLLTTGLKHLVATANGPLVALLTALPYVAAGTLLALAFQDHAADAGRLYFWDLAGAGLAALLTAGLLSTLGGLAVPWLLGVIAAISAGLLTWPGGGAPRALTGLVGVAAAVGLGLQLGPGWLTLPVLQTDDLSRAKPLFRELGDPAAGAKIEYTQWSAVARTDVVSNAGTKTLYIWTDGDVPTQMEPFDGQLESVADYRAAIGYLPYALQPEPERVLCIGPGGGLDVLLGLLGGAKVIEPVEINPALGPITERFKGFYGDLYHRPEVQPGLIIDEGRSYLSRSRQPYDLIYFALAKSATAQQGGIALVDNFLYTTEAFGAYWDHLTDDGLLALVLQERHLTERCLVTAATALLARGLTGPEIAARVAWVGLPTPVAWTPYQQLLLLRKTPFTSEHGRRLATLAADRGLAPFIVPGQPLQPPYSTLADPRVTGVRLAFAISRQPAYYVPKFGGGSDFLDFSPVTDDRPFYIDLSPGLHPALGQLLVGALLAGLLVALLGVVWLRPTTGWLDAVRLTGYFACLGAGFLLVEVALIQKLVLLLGYPTRSLTVILFALLVGSAWGGRLSDRGEPAAAVGRLGRLVGLLAVALVLVGWLSAPLIAATLHFPLALRVLLTVAICVPLGGLMGQPFPTGLRCLGGPWPGLVPAAWAVNGVWSVTGSTLAAAAAAEQGYGRVLVAGAVVYLLAGALGATGLRAACRMAADSR